MTETNDGNEELGSSGTVPFPDRSALGKLRALIALPFFGAAAFLTPTIWACTRIGEVLAGGDFRDIY